MHNFTDSFAVAIFESILLAPLYGKVWLVLRGKTACYRNGNHDFIWGIGNAPPAISWLL